MGWEHYQTAESLEKGPQVGRGPFGVHTSNFSFPNPSNLQHFKFSAV